ncbi:hypothetical protein [Parashewanella curva]|nr:hypothetical protein [Parashewanella curva]
MINNQPSTEAHQLDRPHLSKPNAKAMGSRKLPKSVSDFYIKKPPELYSMAQRFKQFFCCCCAKNQDEETLSFTSLGVDCRERSMERKVSIKTEISPLTKE